MASFGMRSLVAAPSSALLGRKVQAAVGVAGARFASNMFIRYFPKELEIAQLQTLADEFQRTNSAAIKNVRVRLPTKKNLNGVIVSTKGYGFLDYDSQLDVQDVLKNLVKAPATLPSGRPSMSHQLSRDSMSIYLTPQDTDPFVTKYADVENKFNELLKPHGTLNKVFVGRTGNWPLGYVIAEFEEDDAARAAEKALHNTIPDGFEYVVAATANSGERRQQPRDNRRPRSPKQRDGARNNRE